MSLNKILLLGNLGSDPEIRYLPSGKPVASFRIATNRRYKLEGELKEETEWFSIVAYGRLAEISGDYLKKGTPVFVEGRVQTRNWTDAQGARHYKTEVIAEMFRLVGKRNGGIPPAPAVEETEPESETDPF